MIMGVGATGEASFALCRNLLQYGLVEGLFCQMLILELDTHESEDMSVVGFSLEAHRRSAGLENNR